MSKTEMLNMNNYDDYIFNFIYISAMRDAVQRQAYKGEKEWLWRKDAIEKDVNIKCVISQLKDFINQIINGSFKDKNPQDYDAAFYSLAEIICDKINDSKANPNNENGKPKKAKNCDDYIVFSFGNAQKLINMAVKYIYIVTYQGKGIPRENFTYCHCPMDGKMLETVWKNKNKLDGIDLGSSSFYSDGWGKEKTSDARYATFQKAVRQLANNKNCSPIEYDYKHWN